MKINAKMPILTAKGSGIPYTPFRGIHIRTPGGSSKCNGIERECNGIQRNILGAFVEKGILKLSGWISSALSHGSYMIYRFGRWLVVKPHEDSVFFKNIRELAHEIHIVTGHRWTSEHGREAVRTCALCGEVQWRMQSRVNGNAAWVTKTKPTLPEICTMTAPDHCGKS